MFTTRIATLADCPLIHRLAGEVFPATYRKILSPEQIDYMMEWMYSLDSLGRQIKEEGHTYILAHSADGTPAGYVSIQPQGDDLYHLQKLYVLPRFQGQHLGSHLFREAISLIKSLHPGPCRMELNVNRNNPALSFYRRMGMKQVSEGDFPIGNGYYMNDYIMGLEI